MPRVRPAAGRCRHDGSLSALRRLAIVILCALFALLAALVAAGAFTRLDQAAVSHAMPGLEPGSSTGISAVDVLSPLGDDDRTPFDLASDAWLYLASVPLSALGIGICAVVLRRRGCSRAAWGLAAAWVAGNAIEVLTKHALVRPALRQHGLHVLAFDQSLPSGHALRSTLLAGAVALTWRRAGPAAGFWLLTVWVLLVVAGWHPPTDVLAGILLAAALLLAVREWDRRRAGTLG